MKLCEEKISSEHIFKGVVVDLSRDRVKLEDGSLTCREVIDHPGGASVVALDDDGNVFLVRQFRYPFSRVMTEIPAGKLEKGEDPMECAKRELTEETGYEAGRIIPLAEFYPTPAYDKEITYIFFADSLKKKEKNLDEGEFLESFKLPFDEAVEKVMSGEIKDGKTCIGLLKAKALIDAKRI